MPAADPADPSTEPSPSDTGSHYTVDQLLAPGELPARRKQTTARFIVMYCVLVAAFLFLAWRTEINQNAIREGFYEACLARHDTAIEYNIGREALVQLAVNAPNATKDPAEKAKNIKRLRDGLLLPVEVCVMTD